MSGDFEDAVGTGRFVQLWRAAHRPPEPLPPLRVDDYGRILPDEDDDGTR